jgi:hypothetical protein
MSRFAPTLFVGLGGSGVQVLRWVKTKILDGRPPSVLDDEPIAFLGIDFDPSSNADTVDVASLDESEFRHFSAGPIAAAVDSIDREKRPEGTGIIQEDVEQQFEFPEIREWYPDLERKYIRYAQSEATGAAQWRPLGRLGFYIYDRQIYDALSEALTELDRKRSTSTTLGDQPMVIIVSSLSGGTGSSILFDVAVSIRKIRRGVSVRTFLLLPEVFEHVLYRDRIYPNAYATLWELANLKNHHFIFQAHYARIPDVSSSDSPPPFQRVYVVGPWMGDRRPFSEPADVYPHFGELLRLAITKEVRAAVLSSEANASADGGAPLASPASRDIFCTLSAMAIRLIDYRETAEMTILQLLRELDSDTRRELLDELVPLPPISPTANILTWIERCAAGNDAVYLRSRGTLKEIIDAFFLEHRKYRAYWRSTDLQAVSNGLRHLLGFDRSDPMKEPLGLLDDLTDFMQRAVRRRLREDDIEPYWRSPRALESLLAELDRGMRKYVAEIQPLARIEGLEELPRWLGTGGIPFSLPQRLTPEHLDVLHRETLILLNELSDADIVQWSRHAVFHAARKVISDLLERERTRWSAIHRLHEDVEATLQSTANPPTGGDEQLVLDGRRSNIPRLIRHELGRLNAERRNEFVRDLLKSFHTFYDGYVDPEVKDKHALPTWIESTRVYFDRELAVVDPLEDPDAHAGKYSLVSPEALFDIKDLKDALLRCATRIFFPGRVQARAATRFARVLAPHGFRHRRQYYDKVRGWAKAMLGASSGSMPATAGEAEKRIIVILEDLFHPAEDLAGIYDYYSQYELHEDRRMFHIDRRWPSMFPPLISRPGIRGRVWCGNPGCEGDINPVDRRTIFCPSCHRPIRNRCGNRGCLADDLGDRWDLKHIIDGRTCPSCKRPLRTYWWSCPDHGDVPIDKESCPDCVREGREKDRITRRPDLSRRFICPSCIARKLPKPFTLTGDLARFVIDGVNGHDQVAAERDLAGVLNPDGRCPECGSHLVPYCTEPDPFGTGRRHFLYRHRDARGVDRFRCYTHPAKAFDNCATCDFPVDADQKRCPRCATDLLHCRFCRALHLRGESRTMADGSELCAHCSLPFKTPRRNDAGHYEFKAGDRFCSNLFACPVGGRLDEATVPPDVRPCSVCASRELPLLMAETREKHLHRCAYCVRLFGLVPFPGKVFNSADVPKDSSPNDPKDRTPEERKNSASSLASQKASETEQHCCLCGFGYDLTASLAEESDPVTLDSMLAIGTALRCEVETEAVFRRLLGRYSDAVGNKFEEHLYRFLDDIRRPEVAHAVRPRIDALAALYRAQFGCRRCGKGQPCIC